MKYFKRIVYGRTPFAFDVTITYLQETDIFSMSLEIAKFLVVSGFQNFCNCKC